MNDIIVVAPTLNEKENIEILFNKLNATNIKFDLLFIDDNSSDGSQEVIKTLLKENQNINYIFRPKRMGIGSAHKDGLIWSYKKNYKIIITMDTDGTHDPKYIKFLIEKLKNFDMVVSSRFLEKIALEQGVRWIILQARGNAVQFYKNNGYEIVQKTHLLFGEIQHWLMRKELKR